MWLKATKHRYNTKGLAQHLQLLPRKKKVMTSSPQIMTNACHNLYFHRFEFLVLFHRISDDFQHHDLSSGQETNFKIKYSNLAVGTIKYVFG